MKNERASTPHPLPDRPNLRHLKDQARDLLKAGAAASITDAQFKIARLYGFASWPQLKGHIDSLEEVGQLKQAIDANDIARVKTLMMRNPTLHRAPLGYGKDGPLTWVAECRVPWEPPSSARLAMAAWMLEHGSDVHDVLLDSGGTTRYDAPAVLQVLRGRIGGLIGLLDADPTLVTAQFAELDCGQTGGRTLTLRGGTLLHVAAEYGNVAAIALLLDRGADVNHRATVDDAGIGGQTAPFHAVTQYDDAGLEVAQLLLDRGADLTVRVKLPGDYERPGEVVQCTALGYATRFGGPTDRRTMALLQERGAIE